MEVTRAIAQMGTVGRHRGRAQALADGASWAGGLVLADLLRYDLDIRLLDGRNLIVGGLAAVIAQALMGLASGLYLTRWRYGSFDEVAALGRTVVATTLALYFLNLLHRPYLLPRGVILAGGLIALTGMAGTRWLWRTTVDRSRRPSSDGVRRLLVFGAGEAGAQIITAMLRDPDSPYVPVALLDDDPRKRHLRILGVRVVGNRTAMAAAAKEHRADALLVAVPSFTSEVLLDLLDQAAAAGLETRVLAPIGELIDGHPGIADIRPVSVADLLGRTQHDTDVASIAGYVTGRRVLVTGAGGSIGSELCRQLHRFAPSALIMLDRDESALHAVQLSIEGRALLDDPNLVLADIRDRDQIKRLFAEYQPDVVFHAAALKHLVLLERHPDEAIKTNVWGTLHVLDAAGR